MFPNLHTLKQAPSLENLTNFNKLNFKNHSLPLDCCCTARPEKRGSHVYSSFSFFQPVLSQILARSQVSKYFLLKSPVIRHGFKQ